MLDKLLGMIGYFIGQELGRYLQEKIMQKLYGDGNYYQFPDNDYTNNSYNNYYYEENRRQDS
jgi:hypothetical protein